jgi:hypothetical protein
MNAPINHPTSWTNSLGRSIRPLRPHGLWIEQCWVEGAVLTTLGAFSWLILPLVYPRALSPEKYLSRSEASAILGPIHRGSSYSATTIRGRSVA